MKLKHSRSISRRGITLIECIVYFAVFLILTGYATVSFYLLWDNSTALGYTADNVNSALRAGEMWRADIRNATGRIHTENSADGALLKIPAGKDEIIYRFSGDSVWRKSAAAGSPVLVLSHVKASEMQSDNRHQIQAWKWDLEMIPHRARARVPLLFTFEAASPPLS